MRPLDENAIRWIRRVRFVAGVVIAAWSMFLGVELLRELIATFTFVDGGPLADAMSAAGDAFVVGPLATVALVVVAQRARTAMGEPWLPSSPLVVVGCALFPVIAPAWMLHRFEKRLLLHVVHPAPIEAAARRRAWSISTQ